MGNSGIRKLFFAQQIVETQYNSLYDIPVVDIDKREESLSKYYGQKVLIVNAASNSANAADQLEQLRKCPFPVLLFPSNDFRNEPKTYAEIAEYYKGFKVFQKVEVNGKYTHPVFKFIKRNVPELYDEYISNGKQISQDYCKFLISEKGQVIKYLKPNDTI